MAPNITLEATSGADKVEITYGSYDDQDGTAIFRVKGIKGSDNEEDIELEAKADGLTGSALTTVVVPDRLADPLPQVDEVVQPQVTATNSKTTPPTDKSVISVSWLKTIVLTVIDKWGNHVGDVFSGAAISEVRGAGDEQNINVTLRNDGTYDDEVGIMVMCVAWPNSSPDAEEYSKDAGVDAVLNWADNASADEMEKKVGPTFVGVKVDGLDIGTTLRTAEVAKGNHLKVKIER